MALNLLPLAIATFAMLMGFPLGLVGGYATKGFAAGLTGGRATSGFAGSIANESSSSSSSSENLLLSACVALRGTSEASSSSESEGLFLFACVAYKNTIMNPTAVLVQQADIGLLFVRRLRDDRPLFVTSCPWAHHDVEALVACHPHVETLLLVDEADASDVLRVVLGGEMPIWHSAPWTLRTVVASDSAS